MKYLLTSMKDWSTRKDFQNAGAKMVWMNPQEFLDFARPLKLDDEVMEEIESICDEILDNAGFEPLALISEKEDYGRLEAMACLEMGILEVPVIVYAHEKFDSFELVSEDEYNDKISA